MFRTLQILVAAVILAANAQSKEIPRADWVNAMESAIPATFCAPHMYFRQCFSISAESCEETAASTARICLKKHLDKIPGVLQQPRDGMFWGTKIGECAGIAYDATMAGKKIQNAKCNDPTAWQ